MYFSEIEYSIRCAALSIPHFKLYVTFLILVIDLLLEICYNKLPYIIYKEGKIMTEDYNVSTTNEQKTPMTGKQKASFVFNLIVAALSVVAFVFAMIMSIGIIDLQSGEVGIGEAFGLVVLIAMSIIGIVCVAALAVAGLLFFIFSRKSDSRALKICTSATLIYHIAATALSIITFIVAINITNSSGS